MRCCAFPDPTADPARGKGFTGQPIALTSVVQAGALATENFDAIEAVSNEITLDYTPRSVGFGDSQGNKCMLRSYWTNKSRLSGIINDLPSESRLEPKEWGEAVVEAAATATRL